MHGTGIEPDVTTFTWLLVMAFAALMVVRRFKMPYTVALVVIGLIVGATHALRGVQLSRQLVFTVFLPPLLFDAAIRLPVDLLKRKWKPIAILAGPGVVVSTLFIGYAINRWVGTALLSGLLFGALISATDPISVLARFKRLNVDRRLAILVEGESLLNDGTATVLFASLLAAAVSAKVIDPTLVTIDVIRSIAGGVLIGGGVGWGISLIMAHIDDHLAEITLTVIAAFGASQLAQNVGTSGVIAVISSGIVLGYYRGEAVMSATTRAAVYSFWEYSAFVVNSILFLLIGIDVTITQLSRNVAAIGIAIGIVIVARAIVVYSTGLLLRWSSAGVPAAWLHVLNLAGLRGALAIALALSLPAKQPGANTIVAMTYGVVLFTLLPQGLSIGLVLERMGLVGREEAGKDYERVVTMHQAKVAGMAELEKMREEGLASQRLYLEFAQRARTEIQETAKDLEECQEEHGEMMEEQRREIRHRLLAAQQNAIRQALLSGVASDDTARELISQLYLEYGDQGE